MKRTKKSAVVSGDAITHAGRLFNRAVAARAGGKFTRALAFGQRSLKLLEKAEGAASPDVANVLNHLAATHTDLGDYSAAERLYARAVRIMDRHTGDPDLDRLHVQTLNGLATAQRLAGRYAKAEPLLKRALNLAERALGAQDLEVATTLNNLGVLYKYTGQFTRAEKQYGRALRIVEKLEPAFGPAAGSARRKGEGEDLVAIFCFLATLYHNLGGLEHSRGRYARGEPLARRSVELRQRALGPHHPDVAADTAALAALLDGQGKFDQAEPLYRRALAIFERVYGPEHYELAVNFNNLAAIIDKKGQSAEAERLYRRALALKEKLLGRNHPDTAMTLNNLAVCCQNQRKHGLATRLFQRALAIFQKTLSPQHPHISAVRANYAHLRRAIRC